MDLDVANLSEEERNICKGAIEAYKLIRDVVLHGGLYRLENPHDAYRGALNYVTSDQSRSVVFVYQLKEGQPSPVKPQGLDPNLKYTVKELNPAPGRPSMPMDGKVFSGAELMSSGIVPSCASALEASVILISAESKRP
jgi:alpha-galactosidase